MKRYTYTDAKDIARELDLLPVWYAYQNLRIALHALAKAAEQVADLNLPDDMTHLPETVACLRHIGEVARGEWNSAVPVPWIEVMDREVSDTDDSWQDELDCDAPHVVGGPTQ